MRTDLATSDNLSEVERGRTRELVGAAVGLLHPVVVTPAGRLVAGGRRIAAYHQLGRDSIPVTVADSLDSAVSILEAERDENTCRLDMKPTEKVALGRALEELEAPRAMERKQASQLSGRDEHGDHLGAENFTGPKGDTRDIVGAAVGMSGPIYQRAKAVVTAAEDDELAPEVRAEAIKAAEEMDRTGRVTPAFEKVRRAQADAPELTVTTGRGLRFPWSDRRWRLRLRTMSYYRPPAGTTTRMCRGSFGDGTARAGQA
jgi:ParB-like chromosome segregation protein Spo0J